MRTTQGLYRDKKLKASMGLAEAGRNTGKARKAKTLDKMLRAIRDVRILEMPVNQTQVTTRFGLSRRTVIRNWPNASLQELLNHPGMSPEVAKPSGE